MLTKIRFKWPNDVGRGSYTLMCLRIIQLNTQAGLLGPAPRNFWHCSSGVGPPDLRFNKCLYDNSIVGVGALLWESNGFFRIDKDHWKKTMVIQFIQIYNYNFNSELKNSKQMSQQDGVYPSEEQCFLKWSEQDNSRGSKKNIRTIYFSFFSLFKHLHFDSVLQRTFWVKWWEHVHFIHKHAQTGEGMELFTDAGVGHLLLFLCREQACPQVRLPFCVHCHRVTKQMNSPAKIHNWVTRATCRRLSVNISC